LRKIPKQDHSAILDKVGSFGEEPRPTASRHIVAVPGAYRIRVGKWRIAYYVFETPEKGGHSQRSAAQRVDVPPMAAGVLMKLAEDVEEEEWRHGG
jgi:hypothetical protein